MTSLRFRSGASELLALILLAGCASAPADLGRGEVDALLVERGYPVDEAGNELLTSLLAAPLTPETTIRLALLNNPVLQASYASLGFGAADIYEAGRIRNPVLSLAALDSNAAGERDQVTLGLVVSFTDLITMGARKRLSRGAFAALQQQVGAEALTVAVLAEKSYYNYVGAQQVAALRAQVAKAGDLSAALAERFHDAGNLAARALAMERAAASEARLAVLEAEANAFEARTVLASVLGISVAANWSAPAALNLPVQTEDDLETLLRVASKSRLDLASARTQADVQADRLGVVNWTRWLGEFDIGAERERETDGAKLSGPTASWEIPLFNQHGDAVLRADADLQIALYDVVRIAADVDNGVRLANASVRNARARIAEYRNTLIPQRIETVARAQEQVNYMLIGIFELIALKQDEYDAYQGYLEAIRDYWLARADLSYAIGATLPSNLDIENRQIDVEEFLRPQSNGMDHSGHGSMDMKSMQMNDAEQMPAEKDHSGHKMPNKANVSEHDGHMNHDQGDAK